MNLTAALAQCVMCFRTAAAQQAERSRVLDSGIVILLIAPLVVVGVIVGRAWASSKNNSDRDGR